MPISANLSEVLRQLGQQQNPPSDGAQYDPQGRVIPAGTVYVPPGQVAPPGTVAAPSQENYAPGRYTGNTLQTEIGSLVADRNAYAAPRARYLSGLATGASRMSAQMRRDAGMQVALNEQKFGAPINPRGAADMAVRRMRARQQIVNRGEEAVQSQALKDRLQAVRTSMTRRGTLQNALQKAAQIRQGVNTGVTDANNMIKASNYEMYGNVAGMAARLAKGYFDSRQSQVSTGTDQGTAGADYQLMNNPQGNYDFFTQPPPEYQS